MSPSALAGSVDLDDGPALLAADTGGRLWAAARAGAQVRAVAAAVQEGELSRLDDARPRSVVLLARGSAAGAAAELVRLLVGPSASVPVLTAAELPRWIGALDLVVVLATDAGDLELAGALARAVARGAQTVLVGPADGPLAAAGAGRTVLLEPRVPVGEAAPTPGLLVAALAVLGAVGVLARPDLQSAADVLDREVARDHPDRDTADSPAKTLLARDRGGAWVLAGAGPLGSALAGLAAAALLRHAGVVAAGVELADALLAPAVAGGDELLFHDAELDGPAPVPPRRVLVLAVGAEHENLAQRAAALGEVELLGEPGPAAAGDVALVELLILLARIELVAVYASLAR